MSKIIKVKETRKGQSILTVYRVCGEPVVSTNLYKVTDRTGWTNRVPVKNVYGEKMYLNPEGECVIQ